MFINEDEKFHEIKTAWIDAITSLQTNPDYNKTYNEKEILKEIDRITKLYERVYMKLMPTR